MLFQPSFFVSTNHFFSVSSNVDPERTLPFAALLALVLKYILQTRAIDYSLRSKLYSLSPTVGSVWCLNERFIPFERRAAAKGILTIELRHNGKAARLATSPDRSMTAY